MEDELGNKHPLGVFEDEPDENNQQTPPGGPTMAMSQFAPAFRVTSQAFRTTEWLNGGRHADRGCAGALACVSVYVARVRFDESDVDVHDAPRARPVVRRRYSHARAVCHSRVTVAREIERTTATSCSNKPPK
jgi:hypothetical protein